jgi:hypothetical protein
MVRFIAKKINSFVDLYYRPIISIFLLILIVFLVNILIENFYFQCLDFFSENIPATNSYIQIQNILNNDVIHYNVVCPYDVLSFKHKYFKLVGVGIPNPTDQPTWSWVVVGESAIFFIGMVAVCFCAGYYGTSFVVKSYWHEVTLQQSQTNFKIASLQRNLGLLLKYIRSNNFKLGIINQNIIHNSESILEVLRVLNQGSNTLNLNARDLELIIDVLRNAGLI